MSTKTDRDPKAEALIQEAVADLLALRGVPEDQHPAIYKRAADAMLSLRALYQSKSGKPDWRGTSWAYRQAVSDIYGGAGLPPAPNHPVKAALRYHLGNALRERVPSEELTEAGLNPDTPRERTYKRFQAQNDLSDFARSLIRHIGSFYNEPADDDTLARAQEVVDLLTDWLAAQRRAN